MNETTIEPSQTTTPEQGDQRKGTAPVDLEPLRVQALRELGALPDKPAEN